MLSPSRLALARRRKGLSLTRLAQLVGLTRKSLYLYEQGEMQPTESTLKRLADTLDFPVSFLTGSDVDDVPLVAVSFRAMSKLPAGKRDIALASALIATTIDDWITSRFRLPPSDIPSLGLMDPETAAHTVRARWGLGEHPIPNVIHLLEAHGVRIFSLPAGSAREVDAFTFRRDDVPYLFLNTSKSGERGRFDAAHELGHLVLHGEEVIPHGLEAESAANRFAAAFLMPESGVRAQRLHNATVANILRAKKRWRVAAMALTHRLKELHMVTDWTYRRLCIDLSRMGYRSSEPNGITRESSQLLSKVFAELRRQGRPLTLIARDIGLPPTELNEYLLGLVLTTVDGLGQNSTPAPTSALRLVQ